MEEEEEEEVVFTRENRGGSAQHATRATPVRSEEEAVVTGDETGGRNPLNTEHAHQLQHVTHQQQPNPRLDGCLGGGYSSDNSNLSVS